MSRDEPVPALWQIGDWIADPSDDTVCRGGSTVKIEPRVMQLLICLAECAPRVVSIDQLLDRVWGGVIVGPASVYQSISQLRKTLGDTDCSPRYIETVSRKGYRVVASVRCVPVAPPAIPMNRAVERPATEESFWPWVVVAFLLSELEGR